MITGKWVYLQRKRGWRLGLGWEWRRTRSVYRRWQRQTV